MLILSCCESNSLKVGQTCSLNLNKENVVLHLQPADMPQCSLLCQIRTGPQQPALFRASRGCWRRMERMRKWYYIKLARSAWGIRNKESILGAEGEGPREIWRRCKIDLRRNHSRPSWFVGLKLDRCLWNLRRWKRRCKWERELRGEAFVLRSKGEKVKIRIGI